MAISTNNMPLFRSALEEAQIKQGEKYNISALSSSLNDDLTPYLIDPSKALFDFVKGRISCVLIANGTQTKDIHETSSILARYIIAKIHAEEMDRNSDTLMKTLIASIPVKNISKFKKKYVFIALIETAIVTLLLALGLTSHIPFKVCLGLVLGGAFCKGIYLVSCAKVGVANPECMEQRSDYSSRRSTDEEERNFI